MKYSSNILNSLLPNNLHTIAFFWHFQFPFLFRFSFSERIVSRYFRSFEESEVASNQLESYFFEFFNSFLMLKLTVMNKFVLHLLLWIHNIFLFTRSSFYTTRTLPFKDVPIRNRYCFWTRPFSLSFDFCSTLIQVYMVYLLRNSKWHHRSCDDVQWCHMATENPSYDA